MVINRTIIFVETKKIIMKEDLIKHVEQLEIERQENIEIYSEETLKKLDELISGYNKIILSL